MITENKFDSVVEQNEVSNSSPAGEVVKEEKVKTGSKDVHVMAVQAEGGEADKLPTYESINTGAPVSRATIEERIAKSAEAHEASTTEKRPLNRIRERLSQLRKEDDARAKFQGGTSSHDKSTDRSKGPRRSRDFSEDSEGEKKTADNDFMTPSFPKKSIPLPNFRSNRNDEEEAELNAFFADQSMEVILQGVDNIAGQETLEEGTHVKAKILSIHGDSVFVDIGTREQGSIPKKQFPDDFELLPGKVVEAMVTRFNESDGMYDVSLPLAALDVGDWSSLSLGMIVEANVVNVNKGGLDCEVGKLRAFLPISQIAMFRVENVEQFIGEHWKCIVTELDPMRHNLIISRRVLLEKEREELREKLLAELAVGQERDGLVRRIIDAGVFVDLGGVDGFIPNGALAWARVQHPSEIVSEGDRIKVKVMSIDLERNRISLSYRKMEDDPWLTIRNDFKENEIVRGKVVNIRPIGAFVELRPGIDGFLHISEISYKKIVAVSDVLKVNEWIDVKILSIDEANRRISLSLKQCGQDPSKEVIPEVKEEVQAEVAPVLEKSRVKNIHKGPLKGGLGGAGNGDLFDIKW